MEMIYQPQTVIPAQGLIAVWFFDKEKTLDVYPVKWIGVAKTRAYDGKRWNRTDNEVVGYSLREGFFDVINGDDNFMGIFESDMSDEAIKNMCEKRIDLRLNREGIKLTVVRHSQEC